MKARDKNHAFDVQIKRVFEELAKFDVDSEEYKEILATLESLVSINKKSLKISPETIALGVVNLVGILLVLNFERVGVVTSRALNFIKKS